jgi:nicotinamidase/pyrazinamidase
LKEKGVHEIYLAGLTTEYCIAYSVFDALQLGFRPYVILDACRPVNLLPGDAAKSIEKMEKGGAILLSFKEVKDLLDKDSKGLQSF